jgi:hypothetical protein
MEFQHPKESLMKFQRKCKTGIKFYVRFCKTENKIFKSSKFQKFTNQTQMEIKSGVFLSETNQKPCEWCEQNESTLFCLKCDTHQLCKDCSHLLHSKQKLKSHLETIVEITTDFNIEHYICTLHERENEFYCTNCSSFICPDCASEIVGGKHSKHQIKTKKVWKDEFLD